MRRHFVFRLARLLRVRSIQEEVARGEWVNAEAAAREAENHESALEARLRDSREHLGAGILSEPGGVSPTAVLASHAALDAQVRGLSAAKETAHGARSHAEALARTWRERERERRALAELAERERLRHSRDLEKAEEADRDEIAQRRRLGESRESSSAATPFADVDEVDGNGFPRALGPPPSKSETPSPAR